MFSDSFMDLRAIFHSYDRIHESGLEETGKFGEHIEMLLEENRPVGGQEQESGSYGYPGFGIKRAFRDDGQRRIKTIYFSQFGVGDIEAGLQHIVELFYFGNLFIKSFGRYKITYLGIKAVSKKLNHFFLGGPALKEKHIIALKYGG